MLFTVLRRFYGNRWKTLSMLAGLTLALAMAFGVPMYSEAILQQMLNKTFEDRMEETERYPAYLVLKSEQKASAKDALGTKAALEECFENAVEGIGLPVKEGGFYTRYSMLFRDNPNSVSGRKSLTFYEIEGLQDHVSLVAGRMYNPDRADGVVEAVVTQTFLASSEVSLNTVYDAKSTTNGKPVFQFEIVGVVNINDADSIFWYNKAETFGAFLFIDDTYLESMMPIDEAFTRHVTQYHWYAALDYTGVNMDGIDELLTAFAESEAETEAVAGKKILTFNAVSVFESLEEKSSARRTNDTG